MGKNRLFIKKTVKNLLHPKRTFELYCNYKFNSEEYPIICNTEAVFPVLFTIKDKTWESVTVPEIYHVRKAVIAEYCLNAQYILDVKNAIVRSHSDIVVTDKGVIWDKAYFETFSRMNPKDAGLLEYTDNRVRLLKYKNKVVLSDSCISLLGMHDCVWSHFMMQYIQKLYYAADAGLLGDKKVIVLAPDCMDQHTQDVVNIFMSKFHNVELLMAKQNTDYICKKLYHMPIASQVAGLVGYLNILDQIVPTRARLALKQNLVAPFVKISSHISVQSNKLFLVRRDAKYRKTANWKEIESYFEGLGFLCIEPHKMTLEEKVALFFHAEIIVGFFSSAFSNLIFCNKNVKIMVLSNFVFALGDGFIPSMAAVAGTKVLYVTGKDMDYNNLHTDNYIPLPKVKEAYQYLLVNY